MSAPLILPKATHGSGFRGHGHPGCSFLTVVAVNGLLGVPVYFVAFLLAYAFRDTVGWSEHTAFLTPIAAFAVVTGVLSMSLAAVTCPPAAFRILSFGILASLAVNAGAVGLGVLASSSNKDQGSVTADFSTSTDVVVLLALFVLAAGCTWAAHRVRRS